MEYAPKFEGNVIFKFPRLYRGGKLQNVYYKISSLDDKILNENELIFEDIKLKVELPGENKEKVGVKLETGFLNKLGDEFKVYLPESYYKIDLTNVDQSIIDKANEIIKGKDYPGKPNYYKIGKFVNSYLTYDITYEGKILTVNQIYNGRAGICEHFTLLYNAMLNAIGIKTVYISGWAFRRDETSGNENTLGHAWTAALIDNKWIELDATWGLFEGISAGHIFKNFYTESYSHSCSVSSKSSTPSFQRVPNIKLITDAEELEELQNLYNGNNNRNNTDNNNNNNKTNNDNNNDNNNNNKTNNENNNNDDNDTDIWEFVSKSYYIKFSIILMCVYLFPIGVLSNLNLFFLYYYF